MTPIHNWQIVFREAIAPQLSSSSLRALLDGLIADDQRITQGLTSYPPILPENRQEKLTRADAIAFAGWIGEGRHTVGEVEPFILRIHDACRRTLDDRLSWGDFLHWYDDTPREEMRREFMAEIEYVLDQRRLQGVGS